MIELSNEQILVVSGGKLPRDQALYDVGCYLEALGRAIDWVDNHIFPSLSGSEYRDVVTAWARIYY
jgi:hypothetical protein